MGAHSAPVPLLPVSTKLPVMVYIYGGAFLVGGSQGANFLDNYLYDGEEIAVRGNVIVVTINYRLGPLGFLSTGDENLPGSAAEPSPGRCPGCPLGQLGCAPAHCWVICVPQGTTGSRTSTWPLPG